MHLLLDCSWFSAAEGVYAADTGDVTPTEPAEIPFNDWDYSTLVFL